MILALLSCCTQKSRKRHGSRFQGIAEMPFSRVGFRWGDCSYGENALPWPSQGPAQALAIASRRRTDRSSLRVVAIGGGTGLSTLLRGLRRYVASPHQSSDDCDDAPCLISDLAAVVTVTDDGGSSGRLRRGFNMLPPGRPAQLHGRSF